MLGQDPNGVAEGSGAGQHEAALEAVPATLVGLGEAQRRRLDVSQVVGLRGATGENDLQTIRFTRTARYVRWVGTIGGDTPSVNVAVLIGEQKKTI